MQRYFLEIAYDGSTYHGWQVQPNAITVQEVIEKTICQIHGLREIQTVGCGRTDTGVHASSFFLHFDLEQAVVDVEKELYKLNAVLPFDVACKQMHAVHADAHARFDATMRAYEYRVHLRKDPFLKQYSTYLGFEPDFEAMNKAAELLVDQKEFGAFCKSGSDQHTMRCDVREAYWSEQGNKASFHIKADRFLRNMVRAIVGTLLDVGKGKIDIEAFKSILESGDRSQAGTSAPAEGLYLTEVNYPYL